MTLLGSLGQPKGTDSGRPAKSSVECGTGQLAGAGCACRAVGFYEGAWRFDPLEWPSCLCCFWLELEDLLQWI